MTTAQPPVPPWQRASRARVAAKTPLSQDAIVDAALKVLDREGLSAMSMRRVAQELGTGPSSLYAHVTNLGELEDLIFDRVLGELELPVPDPARWQEQIHDLLFASIELMRRHPGVSRLGFGRIPTRDNSMRITETILGLLHAGGIPEQYASWAVDTLSLFTTSAAYEEYVQLEEGQTEENMRAWFDEFGRYLASLPAERYPNILRSAPFMTAGTGDDRLHFGLRLLISGLAATATPLS
jgi:AcrR family transcriptional regulator